MGSEFNAVTEDDFLDPKPLPAGTNPATGKPFTFDEVKREVLGGPSKAAEIEPSVLNRILAGAGLTFTNKWNGLTGKDAAPGLGLEEDTAGRIGSMLPDAVGSVAAKLSVPAQALYGAMTRAVEPGSPQDRAGAALKGALEFGGGQAVASGITRGANALTGNISRAGQYSKAASQNGLDLSAGDMLESPMLRLLEEKSFASPSGNQMGQVSKMMANPKDNPVVHAVTGAYQAAEGRVASAVADLDGLIAQNNLSGVVPRKTYDAIQQIAKRSPDTLNNVRDPELHDMLLSIANYPSGRIPKRVEFSRLDELRKVLGPIQAKVDQQSKSGASNVNTADANRWKQLYKAILSDMEEWGATGANADVLAAHTRMRDTFKNEVLPLREHPFAGRIIEDGYDRSEDIIRDLTSPRNRTSIDALYQRLDQGGKNAFDALRSAKRGTREFRTEAPASTRWEKPLALTGMAALPFIPGGMAAVPWAVAALAGEQALVHGLNSRVGKGIIAGSPQAARGPLSNAAVYSALRSGTQEAEHQLWDEMRQ